MSVSSGVVLSGNFRVSRLAASGIPHLRFSSNLDVCRGGMFSLWELAREAQTLKLTTMQATAAIIKGWRGCIPGNGAAGCYLATMCPHACGSAEMRDFSLLESGIEDKKSGLERDGDDHESLFHIIIPRRQMPGSIIFPSG